MAALGFASSEYETIDRLLASHQQPDGSFKNDVGFLMKEDDPLVCTALAVVAMAWR